MTSEIWAAIIGAVIGGALAAGGGICVAKYQRHFEKQDRQNEELRQRMQISRVQISRALYIEIEGFARDYVYPALAAIDAKGLPKPDSLISPPTHAFPVYHLNAQRIGDFDAGQVDAIVGFYSTAGSVTSTLEETIRHHAAYVREPNPQTKATLDLSLQRLSTILQRAQTQAKAAAKQLATQSKLPFDPRTFPSVPHTP
ncbi:MAG: hypothetical protein LAO19_13180 [Acidobacteriia bacterium]|nr:hypothetical protein [Terriglobia bacterium]